MSTLNKAHWIILALVLLAAGCAGSPQDREYQVYRAFLDSPYAEKDKTVALYEQVGIFFIFNLDQENAGEIASFFKRRTHEDLDSVLVRDFIERNHSPRMIEKSLLPGTLRYDSEFTKKDVYSISRVGFNTEGDEALFYATFSSMAEFGHGSMIHLKKRFGRWRVQDVAAVWVYG